MASDLTLTAVTVPATPYEFTLEPGESRLPKPPITGKAGGDRPRVEILERR